jgi:hypothetical protein
MSVSAKGYAAGGKALSVTKAAANLPQTATATIFTVAGGVVAVYALFGRVTTATGVTATNLTIGVTPTGGSANNSAIATTLAIASKTIGSLVIPVFTSSIGATPIVANGAVAMPDQNIPFLVAPGVITWTTDAGDTGQMQWYCAYLPVDAGATVS